MDIHKLARPGIMDIDVYEPGQDEEGYIKLSSNENPLSPHPHIVQAVVEALESANRYPPSGSPDLTRMLAERHDLSVGEIMVGNGSNEIIDLLVRAFVGLEENVVFPVPSFIVYGLIPKVCGCGAKGILCRDYRLDLEAMRAAVDESTRMVFLCNPNNPTSTYVTSAEVDRFLDGLKDEVFVVMDEAYIDYVDASDYPDSLALRKHRNTIITLRTFSKFYSLAGIRVGYAIADPAVVDILHRVRQPFNVSRLAQVAGMAAVQCAEELIPTIADMISERARVREGLLELGIACPPSQTNFLFADLGESDLDLYRELYHHRVIVRRMGQFGSSRNTYRISVGAREENDQLLRALHEIYTEHPA